VGGLKPPLKHWPEGKISKMLYHWLYQQVFDTPPLKSIEVALIYRTGEGVVRLLIVVVPSLIY
jgi:hypothetical protein